MNNLDTLATGLVQAVTEHKDGLASAAWHEVLEAYWAAKDAANTVLTAIYHDELVARNMWSDRWGCPRSPEPVKHEVTEAEVAE